MSLGRAFYLCEGSARGFTNREQEGSARRGKLTHVLFSTHYDARVLIHTTQAAFLFRIRRSNVLSVCMFHVSCSTYPSSARHQHRERTVIRSALLTCGTPRDSAGDTRAGS